MALSEDVLSVLQEAVPAGLQRVGDRRWVGEAAGQIRKILEFQAYRGEHYSARWGFSVDFVPRLTSRSLAWKRTAASASFDLCIDPIDVEGSIPDWCSFSSVDPVNDIKKMARLVRKRASPDLARINTLHDLRELFQQRSTLASRRFDLTNYVQTNIAWGLLQLATGDQEGRTNRIADFCRDYGIAPETPILAKAKEQALQQRAAGPVPHPAPPTSGVVQGLISKGNSIVAALRGRST